jgi:hypothetical protein
MLGCLMIYRQMKVSISNFRHRWLLMEVLDLFWLWHWVLISVLSLFMMAVVSDYKVFWWPARKRERKREWYDGHGRKKKIMVIIYTKVWSLTFPNSSNINFNTDNLRDIYIYIYIYLYIYYKPKLSHTPKQKIIRW